MGTMWSCSPAHCVFLEWLLMTRASMSVRLSTLLALLEQLCNLTSNKEVRFISVSWKTAHIIAFSLFFTVILFKKSVSLYSGNLHIKCLLAVTSDHVQHNIIVSLLKEKWRNYTVKQWVHLKTNQAPTWSEKEHIFSLAKRIFNIIHWIIHFQLLKKCPNEYTGASESWLHPMACQGCIVHRPHSLRPIFNHNWHMNHYQPETFPWLLIISQLLFLKLLVSSGESYL